MEQNIVIPSFSIVILSTGCYQIQPSIKPYAYKVSPRQTADIELYLRQSTMLDDIFY